MQDFKKLRAWHLARDLSLDVIAAMPPSVGRKVPGLRSQAVRAATSVGANLAEGCSRPTRIEFLHFVEIAFGSLNELDAHLLLGRDAGILTTDRHAALQNTLVLTRRMLGSLIRTLQRCIAEETMQRC